MMHLYTLNRDITQKNRSRTNVTRCKPSRGVVVVAGEVPPVDTVVVLGVVTAK